MTTGGEVLRAMRALPRTGLLDILQGGTPIILAPHPDDEVIGCGGLLAAAARAGIDPVIVYVTDGSGSHPGSRAFPRDALIALRRREALSAARILGVDVNRVHFMTVRDTAAPHGGPAFVTAVNAIVEIIQPYSSPVIFAPWLHDPHADHQAVCKMAQQTARVLAVRHLSYVVWGWTIPVDHELGAVKVTGWRFHGSGLKAGKWHALNAYQSQISDLIDDDPTGFRLDHDVLNAMLSDDEVFLINS